ncbi:hypothetical protein [Geofilum rhodophaeum]|uniref:hypothetical protein n=1 Tax=Geofilum rhodophaeum TaxID=1965019 RepID=UPI000B51F449|nr:hypothetical protein [Geofilum rhodophaeum]
MKLKIGILFIILGSFCLANSQTVMSYKDSGSTIEFFESLLGNSKEYVKKAFEASDYIETDSPSDNIVLFKHKMFVFSIALSFDNNRCSSIIWNKLLFDEAYSEAINFGMYQTDKSGIAINDEGFKRQTYYYHPELDLVYIINLEGAGKANYTLGLNRAKNVSSYLMTREKYYKQKIEREK